MRQRPLQELITWLKEKEKCPNRETDSTHLPYKSYTYDLGDMGRRGSRKIVKVK